MKHRMWGSVLRRCMKSDSIGARLNIGFGIVLLLMAIVGGLAWFQSVRQDDRLRQLTDYDVRRTILAQQMRLAVKDVVVALANLCIVEDGQDRAEEQKAYASALEKYNTAKRSLTQSMGGTQFESLRDALRGVAAAEDAALPIFAKMATLEDSLDREAKLDFYYNHVGGPQLFWQKQLQQLQARLSTAMADAVETSQTVSKQVQVVIAILLGSGLLVGSAAALHIRRSITFPLDEAVQIARAVAAGQLAGDVGSDRSDEIGVLLRSLGEMQAALRRLVGDIRSFADNVKTASDEVAIGNTDLSSRTEEAAGRLQQTSSSLKTMTDAVQHSAESAATAKRLALAASSAADRGGKVVELVVSKMNEISSASKTIADITYVIDGIAFQTNLLALNAAVEAARAAEHGRGFGVVASEVRNLAKRTADAAKEIKGLIDQSAERVVAGATLATEAGSSMREIVSAVEQVTAVMGEIATSSASQSAGLGDITGAVVQLDAMTQQNAALVEESAAAAESLRDQALQLNLLVATFQIDRP